MTTPDLLDQHARAVRASVDVVSLLTDGDLDLATPCGRWSLGELLAHMTVQHDGFAAAASGAGGDIDIWTARPLDADPVSAYSAAADRVIAAFASDGVLEREFALPEISPITTFPGHLAIGFHLVDYAVHGWDVARALDVPYDLEPDVLAAALRVARSVPDGPERLEPGAAFAPALQTSEQALVLDQVVSLLGRDPGWTRPTNT